MQWQEPSAPDERMIRLPAGVAALAVTLLALHAVIAVSSDMLWQQIYGFGALFPARFMSEGLGGFWLGCLNLISYNFLHGSWEHVAMNVLWLIAFGTPIAKRMGAVRFFLLFLLSGIAGGLGDVLTSAPDQALTPLVGASAGVAGLLGGACRFAFSPAHRMAPWPSRPPLLGVQQAVMQPTALVIIAVWVVMNGLAAFLGPMGVMSPDGMPVNIAWVAHLAGFAGGFFLISVVDRPPLSLSGGVGRVDYGSWR